MRSVLGLSLLLGIVAPAEVAAQAPASQASATSPVGRVIRIRLGSDLAASAGSIRDIVEKSGVAVVGEPADYRVDADILIPNFLQLRAVVDNSGRATDGIGVINLGRGDDGSAAAKLAALLPWMQRRQALLALPKPVAGSAPVFCSVMPNEPATCLPEYGQVSLGGMLATLVQNPSDQPYYVAALVSRADLSIIALPVDGANRVARVPPKGKLMIPPTAQDFGEAFTQIVLVSSKPFDIGSLTKGAGLAALDPSTSALVTRVDDEEMAPAMGGGFIAAADASPWTVQLYSTVGYTQEERDLDALEKNPEVKKFLDDRSDEELAHSCGGTLIADDLVLTAAHCVASGRLLPPNTAKVFKDRRVRVGTRRLGRGGETRAVVGVAVHAGYDGRTSGVPNDIALVLLKSDERVRIAPRTLSLATTPAAPGSVVTGLGWGFTGAVAPNSSLLLTMAQQGAIRKLQHNPPFLQAAKLEVLGAQQCAGRLAGRLKDGMICLITPKAIAAAGGKPTFSCRGDSGGPLVRNYSEGQEQLVGLTSFSLGCGYRDVPSVYTDVAYFSKWIEAARKRIKAGEVVLVPMPTRAR